MSNVHILTSVDEAVGELRPRLREYLEKKGLVKPGQRNFKCIAHEDSNPSMGFVRSSDDTVVSCRSCNWSGDIFSVVSLIDSLPTHGVDWVSETIPKVAELFDYTLAIGDPSPEQMEKIKLQKLIQDIFNSFFIERYCNYSYIDTRNWSNEHELGVSITEEEVRRTLVQKGWDNTFISQTGILGSEAKPVFSSSRITYVIKNQYGRPVTFIARVLDGTKPKYIRSPSNNLFDNNTLLMGFDLAQKPAREHGLYIVEGVGDRLQFLRLGHINVVSVNSTNITPQHVHMIRSAGIKDVYLCLDWDEAGIIATKKFLSKTLREATQGLNFHVVCEPVLTDVYNQSDDPDSWLKNCKEPSDIDALIKQPAFDWLLQRITGLSPASICEELIPLIASEQMSAKRELLIKTLSTQTGITFSSIQHDVNFIAEKKHDERRQRILAEVERYKFDVEHDLDNLPVISGVHQDSLNNIEKEFAKSLTGVSYQLARLDEIQDNKEKVVDITDSAFQTRLFSVVTKALSRGMRYTSSTLAYIPGKPNSGKTTFLLNLGIDILVNDPEAIVIVQTIDDSYEQIEPRLITSVAQQLYDGTPITIGEASSPFALITNGQTMNLYKTVKQHTRNFVAEERLIIIDQEDGQTMSPLERTLRYLRNKYPSKKIFVAQDNTHNLADYPNLDQTSRMKKIADAQKLAACKYHCALFATAEYRKGAASTDPAKLKLPTNDDIADSRALYYRANLIMHVYNDLNDRPNNAEFFWSKPENPGHLLPRLNIIFGKNKISGFKTGLNDSLTFDLDPDSVTLRHVETRERRRDILSSIANAPVLENGKFLLSTDYEDDAEEEDDWRV